MLGLRDVANFRNRKIYPGLLFLADFNKNVLSPKYAKGNKTPTFTAARSSSFPASYFDKNGNYNLVTSANVPRFAGGYYDDTGFHLLSGLIIENQSTNYCLYSNDYSQSAWTKSNVTVTQTPTEDASVSPESGVKAQKLTASANNATILQSITSTETTHCFSVFLKSAGSNTTCQITLDNGANWKTISLSSTQWRRFNVYNTVSPYKVLNPVVGIKLLATNDAVYSWGAQLDKSRLYPSSVIINTTTALTRPMEKLKYPIANNRNANKETVFMKVTPMYFVTGSGQLNAPLCLTGTETKSRRLFFGNQNGNTIQMMPNAQDSTACYSQFSPTISRFVTKTIIATAQKDVSPYSELYIDGVLRGSELADNFTANAWGTYFNIGMSPTDGDSSIFEGFIHEVAILNKIVTSTEALNLHNNGVRI